MAEGVEPAGALAQLAGQGVPRVLAGAQYAGEPVKLARIKMAETDLHACAIQEPDHLYKCGPLKGPEGRYPKKYRALRKERDWVHAAFRIGLWRG